jgi:multimeric flavodoxin WrbA
VARRIAEEYVKSDVVVLVTPISFGGYASQLKKAVDRMIGIVSPFFQIINGETHHKPRYDRYPALAAIGFLSEPDEEQSEIFRQLVARNATNLHAPAYLAEVAVRERAAEIQGCSLVLGKTGESARAS